MKPARLMAVGGMLLVAGTALGQDWPQWRGPNRDGRAVGFTAPAAWPKELTQKWKVAVGDGVSTPALVGDKLFVFSMLGGNEVLRCLEAGTGKEVWQDKYPAQAATGPAAGFAGPRASPTVAGGKVVTLGVRGTLSCLDAASGKLLWRNDDFKGNAPRFFTSCSPLVVDGLVVAQLGSESKGALAAYELASGKEKWKWTADGTAYASPMLLSVGGANAIVAETEQNIVAVALGDGKLLWKTPFDAKGKYNACTPVVEGQTVLFAGSGRGAHAVKVEKAGDALAAKELWSNKDGSVQFNTPVIKNGLVFGLSDRNILFCLNAADGKTAWTQASGGQGGYGSIVDAGPVLLALTPSSQLIVFEPTAKQFKELARYKVADSPTYAYPVVSGKRLFIKDKDAVILWMIE